MDISSFLLLQINDASADSLVAHSISWQISQSVTLNEYVDKYCHIAFEKHSDHFICTEDLCT